jgi:E3 ubiquitin-protein ligase TRIP12
LQLKTSNGATIEDYGFVFTLPGFDSVELIEDGKNKSLTLENLQDFIDLVLH